MADRLILGTLDTILPDVPGAGQLLSDPGQRVPLAWLPGAQISDFVVRYEAPESLVAEATIFLDAAGVQLLRLGPATVLLAAPPEGERAMLVRIVVGPAPALAVYDLRLAVDLAQPWLHRVDPTTWQRVDAPFRFEIDADLRVAADASSDLQVYGLSIPLVEIGNTGVMLALDDCELAVGGSGMPVSLRDLAASTGAAQFDGVYARRARLAWLPHFRFPGQALAGLSFDFEDVLIDESGFSFTLDENWSVERISGAPHRLSPRSAMFGRLFDGRLQIAFERITGQVLRNQPVGFSLRAWLELPALQALLQAEMTIVADPRVATRSISLTLTQEAATTIDVDLGLGDLTIEGFSANGMLDDDGFAIAGSCRFAIELPGWTSAATAAQVSFSTHADATSLRVAVPSLELGPLGRLSDADLVLDFAQSADGAASLKDFSIQATLTWHDIAARLRFGALPPALPRPPDDARVTIAVAWAAGGGLELRLEAAAGDPTAVFGFLPAAFRPEVRSVAFGFSAEFADADDFFSAQPGDDISGEAYSNLEFRPTLSSAFARRGIVSLTAGDSDGFVTAELRATVAADGSDAVSLDLGSPIALQFALPAVTDGPFLTARVSQASMRLATAAGAAPSSADVEITGEFSVVPASLVDASAIMQPIAGLLTPLMANSVHGTVSADLQLRDDRAALTMMAHVDALDLEIDLLDLVGQLASGRGAAARTAAPAQRSVQQELDLDLSFRFALDDLVVAVGSVEDAAVDTMPASVELDFTVGLAGADVQAFAQVSTEELAIGIKNASLPLTLPAFPLRGEDLQSLAGPDGRWTAERFDAAIAALQGALDSAAAQAGRGARALSGTLAARQAMLRFLRDVWTSLSSDAARRTYQDGVVAIVAVLDAAFGLTHSDSRVKLVSDGVELRLRFDDPGAIAVEGSASLTGFADDDPLHGLEGLHLRAGLTPDQIYFGLEASGEPVPLPPVGRYRGGQVSLSQLTVGYGFTKNSLAMSFAGELVYPEHLTEDVETSRAIGFGIKLPRYNRLAFRLDLIPVPGPIPLVPTGEFAFDLRTPGLPGIAGTQVCTPVFDGLELRIPGVLHADVKLLTVSPLFGIIPAVNVRFAGDIDLGDAISGLTIVCDDLLWLAGVGELPTPTPISGLIDPTAPFFQHLCVNLRCAGFGINFDLERPFPLPNPLIVFDLLALIADPLRPLDPDGPLAQLLRISLRDARIALPRWAQRLIPGGPEVVRHQLDVEIDVGTLIAAAQWIARNVPPVLARIQDAFAAGRTALDRIVSHPPRLDARELIALLPPEVRAIDCELSFAGFAASATIVIVVPEDVRAATPVADALWRLPALQDFSRSDLDGLPALPRTATAVLAAARIELLNSVSYRFVGELVDDGSFALQTRLDVPSLPLAINGFPLALPFRIDGRLLLTGQVSAARRAAEIRARGSGSWDVVPGVVRIAAGVAKLIELRLSSNGRFGVKGDGVAEFFGDALRISGTLDASDSHFVISGALRFALGGSARRPALVLDAGGILRVGPGATWAFGGQGKLKLFDLEVAEATVRFSEREVAVHAALDRRRWRIGALTFDTQLAGELDGAVIFPERGAPHLRMQGRGTIEALGAALAGAFAIDLGDRILQVKAEGALTWLGKPWFAARMSLGSDGRARVAGRTSVVLDLTPSQVMTGIQVASLFLRADLVVDFGFSARGRLADYELDVDWSLGVRLPGAEGQTFVLAMQKAHFDGRTSLAHSLLQVQGMRFIPLPDAVIPIPIITSTGTAELISARLNVPIPLIDQVPFLMTDEIEQLLKANLGRDFVVDPKVVLSVPKDLKVTVQNRRLSDLSAALALSIHLLWKNDTLGFELRRGRQRKFIGLDQLL